MDDELSEHALHVIEQAQLAVAAFTGMKQQFIDAGWSPEGAEWMVIAMIRQAEG